MLILSIIIIGRDNKKVKVIVNPDFRRTGSMIFAYFLNFAVPVAVPTVIAGELSLSVALLRI